MAQTLSWIANTALFVLCCFLLADTANSVFAAILTPSPEDAVAPASRPRVAAARDDGRQAILSRNLFNVSTLAPPPPEPPPVIEEDLEETKLPLRLMGTVASNNPALSRAAVEDEQKRETVVVEVGDRLQSKATVHRIERRRIVLSENGALRELKLIEPEVLPAPRKVTSRSPAPSRSRNRAASRSRGRNSRLKKVEKDRFRVSRTDVEAITENAAALFSQARILPKYEDGSMVGLQVNAIKPGSLFEELGVQDGEVITEVNGIAIDSPEQSAKIMAEFTDSDELIVVVKGADGSPRRIQIDQE